MRMSTAPIPLRVILFIFIIPFIVASILVLIYTNTFRLSDLIKNSDDVESVISTTLHTNKLKIELDMNSDNRLLDRQGDGDFYIIVNNSESFMIDCINYNAVIINHNGELISIN